MTCDVTPRYCQANPFEGGKQAVAESYRNLCAVGTTPLAITDNLNFGNPEKPEIMTQFVKCLDGMGEACRVLEYPIVSGNVSLYNETSGRAIFPTPAIGGIGVMVDWRKAMPLSFKGENETIFVIGDTRGHLGQTLYAREIHGVEAGDAPPVDLTAEKTHGTFIRRLIDDVAITACHDVSDGGIAVAVAEMAMAGGIGCTLERIDDAAFWFGEDQARYIVTTKTPVDFMEKGKHAHIPVTRIGLTGGIAFVVDGVSAEIAELVACNEAWLPDYIG
jgi:phosphoribosylformylglycinamidine synthase